MEEKGRYIYWLLYTIISSFMFTGFNWPVNYVDTKQTMCTWTVEDSYSFRSV